MDLSATLRVAHSNSYGKRVMHEGASAENSHSSSWYVALPLRCAAALCVAWHFRYPVPATFPLHNYSTCVQVTVSSYNAIEYVKRKNKKIKRQIK